MPRSPTRTFVLASLAALVAGALGLAFFLGGSWHRRHVPGPSAGDEPGEPIDPETAATLGGRIVDALGGEPLTGVEAEVVLERARAAAVRAKVGSDGRFLVQVAPGEYRARVVGTGLYGHALPSVSVLPKARAESFDLRAVRLAVVEGRVVGPDGSPAEGATVTFAARSGAGAVRSSDLVPVAAARTDARGGFVLAVAPGEVVLDAAAPGLRARIQLPGSLAPGGRVRDVTIGLVPTGAVEGLVQDASGAPVAGASVTVTVLDAAVAMAPRVMGTGRDGRFHVDDLPPGQVEIDARAPGLAPGAPTEVAIDPGQTSSVGMRLPVAGAIRGRVIGPDGNPAVAARVRAITSGGREIAATATDTTGAYALAPLGVGPYEVVVDAGGLAPARHAAVASPSDNVVLRLTRMGGLAGRVAGPSGEPILDFTVKLVRCTPIGGTPKEVSRETRFLSADGSYTLSGLEPGTCDLLVTAPGRGGRVESRGVVIPPGRLAPGSARFEAELPG